MSEDILGLLRSDYADMQDSLATLKARLREKYRALEAAEFEREAEVIKRTFAVRFVRAREAGVRRSDLASVLRTNDGRKFKEFMELGGGVVGSPGRPVVAAEASEAVEAVEAEIVADSREDRFEFVKKSAGFEAEWVTDYSLNYHGLNVELVWDGDELVPVWLNPDADPAGVWRRQLMLPRRLELFTEYGMLLRERSK